MAAPVLAITVPLYIINIDIAELATYGTQHMLAYINSNHTDPDLEIFINAIYARGSLSTILRWIVGMQRLACAPPCFKGNFLGRFNVVHQYLQERRNK